MAYVEKEMNLKQAFVEYNVTQPTTNFALPFEFVEAEQNLRVRLNRVDIEDLGYSFLVTNNMTVQVTPAIPHGTLSISRETDIDENLYKFTAGALFEARTMDKNFEQIRHSQQEVRYGFEKLSDDTYMIIDTLQDVGQAAQDAADAAEQAAQTANDAAAQVNDKVSQVEIDYIHENGAALPYKEGIAYEENAVVVKDGVLQQWKGGFWVLTSDSKQFSFKSNALSSTMRTVFDKLEEQVSVKDFGAKGDGVADDTAAINLAIAYASQTPVNNRVSSVVYFPAGIYRITSTLTVATNGVELRGEYESGANMNESALGYGGTHIYYDAENGLPAIKIGKSSGLQWGNGFKGIRLSANTDLVNKPIGLQIAGLSEAYLSDFHINRGFSVGLDVISSTMVWMNNFDIGNCSDNMRVSTDSSTYVFGVCRLWIDKANFWNAQYNHVNIICPAVINVSESWMEFAQRFFNIQQIKNERMRVEIAIQSTETSVVVAYTPNDPAYNIANNRVIKARALDGATEPLEVYFATSNNSTFYVENADYAFEYIRGTNQNDASRFTESVLSNSVIYGVNTAGVHSDTYMSSVSAIGNVVCRASLFNEILRPITSDNCQLNALISRYGHWDMSEGRPLRLPSKPPTNYALDGQIYFNNTQKRVQYTYNGATFSVPRPNVMVLGDQNYIYDNVASSETIIFNAPLSGIRSIGFDANNVFNGQKVRVCRTAASSGASHLGVIANDLEVKRLNSGQWCDLEFGAGGWYVTASGNL